MALEATLEEAGYEPAGPFVSRAEALQWLERETPGIAILDYALKDGACAEVARTLRQRQVPFLIYSGYRPSPDLLPDFHGVPWVEKPIERAGLLKILADMVAPA
jgi:DNA-binding response OmpR family regulator